MPNTRWTLDVDTSLIGKIDTLAAEGNMSRKEFLNAALTLMTWAINHVKENRVVGVIDEPSKLYRELRMDELERYRSRATPKASESI